MVCRRLEWSGVEVNMRCVVLRIKGASLSQEGEKIFSILEETSRERNHTGRFSFSAK